MAGWGARRIIGSLVVAFALGCVLGLKLDRDSCGDCENKAAVDAVLGSIRSNAEIAERQNWPQWCGGPSRNSVSLETGLIDGFEEWHGGEGEDVPHRNVLWKTPLTPAEPEEAESWVGRETWETPVAWGSPVVADGRIYLGGALDGSGSFSKSTTGALWCFRESDGKLLWTFRSRFVHGIYNRSFGIAATPTVEGDRVYVVNHLGDVVCLDAKGLSDGNDGPFRDEASLLTRGLRAVDVAATKNGKTRVELGSMAEASNGAQVDPLSTHSLTETDGDIIWRYDMYRELSCRPHNCLSSGILLRNDLLFVGTCSTGAAMYRTQAARTVKNLWTPIFIALDKKAGTLVAVNDRSIPRPFYHGANASPSFGVVDGKELIFYGDGRGVCYAFDPTPVTGEDGKPGTLKTVWRMDCTKPTIIGSKRGDKKIGPMTFEIIATPVFHDGRVYVALGNDPKYSGRRKKLPGRLVCIDAAKTGDITGTGLVWRFDDIRSSCSSVAVAAGLVFAADLTGVIYCLEAESGKLVWRYQTSPVWSSPLVADGRVYVGTQGSGLVILAASREKRVIHKGGKLEVAGSPAVADGVMYLGTHHALFALKSGAGAPR